MGHWPPCGARDHDPTRRRTSFGDTHGVRNSFSSTTTSRFFHLSLFHHDDSEFTTTDRHISEPSRQSTSY